MRSYNTRARKMSMSLMKWLIKMESGGSSWDQRALRAATEAVEAVQQDRKELECK